MFFFWFFSDDAQYSDQMDVKPLLVICSEKLVIVEQFVFLFWSFWICIYCLILLWLHVSFLLYIWLQFSFLVINIRVTPEFVTPVLISKPSGSE